MHSEKVSPHKLHIHKLHAIEWISGRWHPMQVRRGKHSLSGILPTMPAHRAGRGAKICIELFQQTYRRVTPNAVAAIYHKLAKMFSSCR